MMPVLLAKFSRPTLFLGCLETRELPPLESSRSSPLVSEAAGFRFFWVVLDFDLEEDFFYGVNLSLAEAFRSDRSVAAPRRDEDPPDCFFSYSISRRVFFFIKVLAFLFLIFSKSLESSSSS